jgi:hypothetical protein
MTPTLRGRWQTRLLLLGTLGLVATLIVGLALDDLLTPLALLGYVLLLGFGWDILYHYLQARRWDRDWPPAFQLAGGIAEGIAIWCVIHVGRSVFEGLPGVAATLTTPQFVVHYGTVWFMMFLGTQGPLRVILPRWRYRGGELW